MSDGNVVSCTDDLKELQKRVNQESIRHQFRSKLIGGLNEEDVTNYIEHVEENYRKLEKEHYKEVEEHNAVKKKLCIEMEEKDSLQESIDEIRHNLDTYIAECKNKDLLIQSLNEKSNYKITQLQNDIHKMADERNELQKLLSQSEMETEELKKSSALFEENNIVLKSRINDLENENSQIAKLQSEIEQVAEERNELTNLLSQSSLEIEEIKKSAALFEEDNNVMKSKIVELEKQNYEIPQLKIDINKVTQERNELNTLLSESREKIDQIKEAAAIFEEDNIVMKSKIADLEKENSQIPLLQNEITQMAEERDDLEMQLSQTRLEYDEIVKSSALIEEDNNVMKLKILDMQENITANEIEKNELNKAYQELKQQFEFEKLRNEKQCIDLELYRQQVIGLEATIAQNEVEIQAQRKISEKAEIDLKLEKAKVSSIRINGFKDEVSTIYKKMESLAEEANLHVKTNDELQQKLIAQQLRADKAENDLSEFTRLVAGLKDKLFSEHNLLESQFKEIVDKQDQKQPESNDCLIDLRMFRKQKSM